MMELVYIYILIGLIGGVTAGMLGLGGGIIFVPGLLLVHKFSGLFAVSYTHLTLPTNC